MTRAAALTLVLLCASTRAAADPVTDAEAAVAKAASDLDAVPTSDCPALCKALESLESATKHLCALAKPGDAEDQKRCNDAKVKLEIATKKVRAKCPACAASPPADVVATPPTQPPMKPTEPLMKKGAASEDGPAEGGDTKVESEHVRAVQSVAHSPRLGLGIAPLRLISAPHLFALSLDLRLQRWLSVRADGAFGSDGGFALDVGLAPRIFFAGDSYRGLFLGLDARYTKVPYPSTVLVNGFSLAPVVGARLPFTRRLWVSAHAGPAIMLGKQPEHRIVPRLDLTLGVWL